MTGTRRGAPGAEALAVFDQMFAKSITRENILQDRKPRRNNSSPARVARGCRAAAGHPRSL